MQTLKNMYYHKYTGKRSKLCDGESNSDKIIHNSMYSFGAPIEVQKAAKPLQKQQQQKKRETEDEIAKLLERPQFFRSPYCMKYDKYLSKYHTSS